MQIFIWWVPRPNLVSWQKIMRLKLKSPKLPLNPRRCNSWYLFQTQHVWFVLLRAYHVHALRAYFKGLARVESYIFAMFCFSLHHSWADLVILGRLTLEFRQFIHFVRHKPPLLIVNIWSSKLTRSDYTLFVTTVSHSLSKSSALASAVFGMRSRNQA